MATLAPHVPTHPVAADLAGEAASALGGMLLDSKDHVGELTLTVARESVAEACAILRDRLGFQQLMEIAGVDYPERPERFEVNYQLLSVTRNLRLRVKVLTDEAKPVPTVTGVWPVAGWLEREVFDLYGVTFAGHPDLRRILTDYGFEGFPLRKDFPLTGHVEMRYSELEKRVVYEPVSLAQDFRTFDFLTPWEGPEYRLPGDEKAVPEAPGAPSPAPAAPPKTSENVATPDSDKRAAKGDKPYTGEDEERGRAGAKQADAEARKPTSEKAASEVSKNSNTAEPKPAARSGQKPSGDATA
ncbi:NADH-quinone oxidoreductase subunit C [Sphingomonas ginkgonis]|uniref:NADH-quinone oxidoreductase subunit C n=1 Tax=Sphingomonas ginkgonis TaxID=2315330 RepID=A0A429VAU5_9SPHN|nr:NADH-quinone oxidoreductase subunit C [Sphingomonas ginkgonis]RST30947.1 NADH-quinone oxidoreductase subunit C [Sphingomonas ginkgonis]